MAEAFSTHNGNGSGIDSLESRYRHLDDRVGRLGQEVAGISATLSNVSHTLDTISRRVNEPQRTQWSALIAACAFVASLGYSALMPVKETVNSHADKLESVVSRQREVAAELGQVTALKESSRIEHDRTHQYLVALEARDRETAEAVAATQAQLDALAERVRDVDLAGSRKWVAPRD